MADPYESKLAKFIETFGGILMLGTIKYVKEKMNANQEPYRTLGLTNGMTGLICREEQFFPYLVEGYTYDFTITQEGRWNIVTGLTEASAAVATPTTQPTTPAAAPVQQTMEAIATPLAPTPAPQVQPLPQVQVPPPAPQPPTAAPVSTAFPSPPFPPQVQTPQPQVNQDVTDHTLQEMFRSRSISYLSISARVQRALTDLWVSQVFPCTDLEDYAVKVNTVTQRILELKEEYIKRTTVR